ncbi:nascent polypeptide-associated complex subunit alpha, muscle-specific form-like [Engraulis encrasicolus]|uniref:nascent polypeptide-associated complex subunit alpha, muscle-specific form-like n=1 Tax=Engraulis encrasicolus TaxID=184585 RepID=UPI002FD3F6A4
MGYIGRKRKWKSGDRPSEPADPPSGESSPQPGPSGEPAALSDSRQAGTSSKRSRPGAGRAATPPSSPQSGPSGEPAAFSDSRLAGTSYKRSRPGTASPRPRAATPPSPPPQLVPSIELAAIGDDGQMSSSSTSSRPGAANPLPRAVDTPRSPQPWTFRDHVALAGGAATSMSSRPGAPSPLPRAVVDQPRSPWPVASGQVFESREVPGAGPPAHGDDGYPSHTPPQVQLAPNHSDLLLNAAMASLPQSTANALAVLSTQVAALLVCSGNDVHTRVLLENFLGETNMHLSHMISDIVTHYNGGLPLVLFDPDTMAEEVRCPICLEDYQHGDELSVLPCQHRLHSACARRWLERSRTCPVCRAGV